MSRAKRAVRATLRRTYDFAVLTFGVLLALPLRLMSPLYRIEIQPLLVERIGHLAIEPELLLSLRDAHPPVRTKTWFYERGPVCNPFLVQMWRRVLTFGPSWLLHPIWLANRRFPWLDLGARGWDELHFDLRYLDHSPPHLVFTDAELERGRELLHSLGIEPGEPFVCLAVRDDAYLTSVSPERDWRYHDYRNSDIASYVPLAEELARAGLAVLRMGAVVSEPFVSPDARVVDYASSGLRSDFGDVFLFAHCRMCISTSTGVDSLAMAFRRPMGIVNLPGTGGLQLGKSLRLVMFKDLIDDATGARLDLMDPRRIEAMAAFRTDWFETHGLRLVDNSIDELVAFGREMLMLESGDWRTTPDEGDLEQAFLKLVDPARDYTDASFHLARCWLVRS